MTSKKCTFIETRKRMSKKLENARNLYLEGILEGNYVEAINKYTGERYTQHSTGVKDGKEGFIEFFADFTQRCPERDIKIIRGWEDGQYVFLHVYQNINNGESEWVTADFFDTNVDDKIIEHWDVIAAYSATNPSGHSSIDGPTEVKDLDRTEENKQLVKDLLFHALMEGGDPSKISAYIGEEYVQHNKEVSDGRDVFMKLAMMPDRPLNYSEIVLCVGQGNFVATLSKANWNDGELNQDYAQVDIFRIEDGLIVEHWDNVEPVPEVSVNSGKF